MENKIPVVQPADNAEHILGELRAEDFPLKADKELLADWRERVQHLHVMQDFIRHPAVAEFVQIGLKRIQAIDFKLKERDLLLNPARAMERAAYIVEREVHELYLNFFNVNPDAELAAIAAEASEARRTK